MLASGFNLSTFMAGHVCIPCAPTMSSVVQANLMNQLLRYTDQAAVTRDQASNDCAARRRSEDQHALSA